MIGLLIISHYGLGKEFRTALEHVCGQQAQFKTISVFPEDTIESKIKEVLQAIKEIDRGEGVLLITDMYGATPSNIAFSALEYDVNCEVISGVNMPMLVKLASTRKHSSLMKLAVSAKTSGQTKICLGQDMICRYSTQGKRPS